jgi:carboxypeptidase PM20D1
MRRQQEDTTQNDELDDMGEIDQTINTSSSEEQSSLLSRRFQRITQLQNKWFEISLLKRLLIVLSGIILVILTLCVALLAIVLIRDVSLKSKQLTISSETHVVNTTMNEQELLHRFSKAIQIPTVYTTPLLDEKPFVVFQDYLKQNFQLMHEHLTLEIFENHTLLFKWQGSENTCDPILLLSHYDVVPPGDESRWTFPPFNGTVYNGYIYGRGTLDTKSTVVATCEAVETLLRQQFVPTRTIYLAFPHNEEVVGSGASAIAHALKSRGITLSWILDEGTPIDMLDGKEMGISAKAAPDGIAYVGIAEKGQLNIKLSVDGEGGGHASAPPVTKTAIYKLSRAIVNIEGKKLETSFVEPVTSMIEYLLPEMDSLRSRVRYHNLPVFGGYLLAKWESSRFFAPHIKSAIATTMFNSGVIVNVLPQSATANINIRLRPIVDTCQDTIDYIKALLPVNDQLKVEVTRCAESHTIASTTSEGFSSVQRAIRTTYKQIIVAPALFIAGTDSRHFRLANVVKDIYLFSPYIQEQDVWLHSVDEKISVAVYKKMIQFYAQVLVEGSVCS